RALIFLTAVLLAIFVLDAPWGLIVVASAAVVEVGESIFWIRWSQRRRAGVGAETLIGQTAEVVKPLAPVGQVQVKGELWRARALGRDARLEHAAERLGERPAVGKTDGDVVQPGGAGWRR